MIPAVHVPDENVELPPSTETPPPSAAADREPVVEAQQTTDSQLTPPEEIATQSVAPTAAQVPSSLIQDQQSSPLLPSGAESTSSPAEVVNEGNKVGDTVDAPVSPSLALQEAPVKMEEPQAAPAPVETPPEKEPEEVTKTEEENQVASTKLQPAAEVAEMVIPVTEAKEETATKTVTEVSQPPPPAPELAAPQTENDAPTSAPEPEATPAETAEPLLSNGLPQEIEELSEDMAFSDTIPLDKPNTLESQESTPVDKKTTSAQEEVEEKKEKEKTEDAPPAPVSCPPEKSTMQGNNKWS